MGYCIYCKVIRNSDPNYKARRANWDLDGESPRCSWHWRFICDRCGRIGSFHGLAWCEKRKEFFCLHCAPRHRKSTSPFWIWDYFYELWCDKCSSYHAALDWLESAGRHPWQKDTSARRALKGLSREKRLPPGIWVRWAPLELQHPSLEEIQKRWDSGADEWNAGYGKYGDSSRQNIFNPALFPLLGDVKGKRILDAGCGAGYLCRLLAEKGAKLTGVDLSRRFIGIAKGYEKKKPLDIRYECADLADLSRFSSLSFDMVVSVYVLCDTRNYARAINEIARVLKPNGRFILLIEHPCFGWQAGGWERVPKDSERNEDYLYFKVDDYFREGTQETQWGRLPVLLNFHRPLSHYFHFLKKSQFLVRDLIEPRPLRRALEDRPRDWERENRIPPVLIIDAVKQ